MFSDTHFHFKLLTERGADGADVLSSMAARNCFFGLDIGTEADDLQKRQKCAADAISCIAVSRASVSCAAKTFSCSRSIVR